MTKTTVSTELNDAPPDQGRKARRTVVLALVHLALAVGILALFVFLQMHRGQG